MHQKYLKILIACVSALAILLISLFLFLFLIFRSTSSSSLPLYKYQLIRTSPSRPLSLSFGTTQLNRKIEKDSYLSYYNQETKNTVFIQSFESESFFTCSGSCFCNDATRRTTSTLLSNGLTILLSSVSVVVAGRMARDAFRDQCAREFTQTCDEEGLFAEVESCGSQESPSDSYEDDTKEKGENQEGGHYVQLECKGNCEEIQGLNLFRSKELKNPHLLFFDQLYTQNYKFLKDWDKKNRCKDITLSEVIEKVVSEEELRKQSFIVPGFNEKLNQHCQEMSIVDFKKLGPFSVCVQNTKIGKDRLCKVKKRDR